MNLVCPHCQKMVTVSEQNAGQSMKCPLCGNAFQAPVLPETSARPAFTGKIPLDIPLAPLPPSPEMVSKPSTPEGPDEPTYRVIPEPTKPVSTPPPRREPAASTISQKPIAQQPSSKAPPPPPPP